MAKSQVEKAEEYQAQRKKRKRQLFEDIADTERILVGAFRNEYAELYVLYRYKSEPQGQVYITGDEMDWKEVEFNHNQLTAGKGLDQFMFNQVEIKQLLEICHYLRV